MKVADTASTRSSTQSTTDTGSVPPFDYAQIYGRLMDSMGESARSTLRIRTLADNANEFEMGAVNKAYVTS